jgi:hypothetical protein
LQWLRRQNGWSRTPNAPLLTRGHRQALLEIVESGPIPAVDGVVRWRLIDRAPWVRDAFRILIGKQTLSRELRPSQGGLIGRFALNAVAVAGPGGALTFATVAQENDQRNAIYCRCPQ